MKTFVLSLIVLLQFVVNAACAAPAIFSTKIGDFEVHMLSELQSNWDANYLTGVSSADKKTFLPNGRYQFGICAFLVKTPERTILVDTGAGRYVLQNLASLRLNPLDIDVILLTHGHGDHVGGLVRAGRAVFPNAVLYASEKEAAASENLRENLLFYEKKHRLFSPGTLEEGGTELFPGVRAASAYGHTPGHTVFLFESQGEKLLIWGDLTHAITIQAARPGVGSVYDADPVKAAETRRSVFRYVAAHKIPVAGMFIPYPAIGSLIVLDAEKEIYSFQPLQ